VIFGGLDFADAGSRSRRNAEHKIKIRNFGESRGLWEV